MRRHLLLAAIVCGFFCIKTAKADDPLFYVSTVEGRFGNGGRFGLLDPITGNISMISTNSAAFGGLAFGQDGVLYGLPGRWTVAIHTNNGGLYHTGNPVTSGGPNIATDYGYGMTGLPNGIIYAYGGVGVNSTVLYMMNPSNAVATTIGDMGVGLLGGFAADSNGNLYMTKGSGTEGLYSVNSITGAATFIGLTGTPDAFALGFANGTLYMTDILGGIWTVDTASGASSQISTYDKNQYGFIAGMANPFALSPTPEPSTLMMLGFGSAALVAFRFKRYTSK